MYNHKETVEFLQSIIGQEIKVYTIDNNKEESFIGKLQAATSENILVDCKTVHNTQEKQFLFFNKKVYISQITTTKDYRAIYKVIAISPEALADIRNTLGPVKSLLALLQGDQKENPLTQEAIEQEIERAKGAVEYLSNFQVL
jgi:hypothetical protein